jgi:ribonuclease T2
MPPSWVRLDIADGDPSLRWVDISCGQLSYSAAQKKSCDNSSGLADSNVLALSWQPAFCATYGYKAGKPECLNLTAGSYESKNMVLHGLWPNQNSCGIKYGYCGGRKQARHCNYPALSLSNKVAVKLAKFMPSYAHESCLERHEWYKHGMCQTLSADDYFALALDLAEQFNNSSFGSYLENNIGEVVALAKLKEQVSKALGHDAGSKVFLAVKMIC